MEREQNRGRKYHTIKEERRKTLVCTEVLRIKIIGLVNLNVKEFSERKANLEFR